MEGPGADPGLRLPRFLFTNRAAWAGPTGVNLLPFISRVLASGWMKKAGAESASAPTANPG